MVTDLYDMKERSVGRESHLRCDKCMITSVRYMNLSSLTRNHICDIESTFLY